MEGFAKESRNAQATPACNRSMTLATPISKLRGSSVAQSDGALTNGLFQYINPSKPVRSGH